MQEMKPKRMATKKEKASLLESLIQKYLNATGRAKFSLLRIIRNKLPDFKE